MKTQRGFTLIELVVVILILGVLAAVAVPKFIDVSLDSHNAVAKGVAGAMASGSAINYAAFQAGAASAQTLNAANVCTVGLMQALVTGVTLVVYSGTPLPDNQFALSGTGDCTAGTGNLTVVCTVLAHDPTYIPASAPILCAR